MITKPILRASLAALAVTSAYAEGKWSSPYDIWDQAYGDHKPSVHLYENQDNPYIQEVNFMLRAQYQGAVVNANQGEYPGSHHSTSEWRRFRLGGSIKFLHDFKLTNIWNIGGLDSMGYRKNGVWYDHGTTRGNLYDASLTYTYSEKFSIAVGKHYPGFFVENKASSADYRLPEIPTIENQFAANSGFGVRMMNDESKNDFGWQLACWSNTDERSRGTWGTWQSAYMLVGVSYRVDKAILQKGRVNLDWIHNTEDMDDMATSVFRDNYTGTTARDILALYYRGTEGPAELILEALWANNLASYKNNDRIVKPSNVVGLVAMPMYMLTDHIQVGARAQWSKGADAVKLYSRYANLARTDGNYVDEMYSLGIGFNFFLYANDHPRLKIMTFVDYGNTNRRHGTGGFTGWTFIGGVYTNF